MVDSAIVADSVIGAAAVVDAVETIVVDLVVVADAVEEEATMIRQDFADGVDEEVLTGDVVVAVDAAEAVIAVDLVIGTVFEAVEEAVADLIVGDVVASIAVGAADPIAEAPVDAVEDTAAAADLAIVDLDVADMDAMMVMDSRPDMGAIIKTTEPMSSHMILIINTMIHNHVVMVTNHMIQDRTDRNHMVMMVIKLADTDKIRNGYKFIYEEFKGTDYHQIFLRIFMVITVSGWIRTARPGRIWTGWLWPKWRIWKWLWSATTSTGT